MKKALHQELIDSVRKATPLFLRTKIGPVLARIYYIDRLYLHLLQNKESPVILSIPKTIDKVLEENLSVIRFGDGEIALIDGFDLPFQKRSEDLVNQLEKIIKTDTKDLLICIPGMWGKLSIFAPYAYHFIMHHMYRHKHIWESLIVSKKIYGDTNMTRHYLAYNDKNDAGILFNKIFSIWENKKVLLIEGEKSRLGVGNDMFDKTSSLGRILCPPENSYEKKQEILEEAMKLPQDTLVLLSLGPAAKVIAYELFLKGYRVIDIGHIDMEYEMFLRKETKQVRVAHKYFNEINERTPIDCQDEKYLSQIITTIK